jgi:hypothetical protein
LTQENVVLFRLAGGIAPPLRRRLLGLLSDAPIGHASTIVLGLEEYFLGAIAALMSRDEAGRAQRCGLCATAPFFDSTTGFQIALEITPGRFILVSFRAPKTEILV